MAVDQSHEDSTQRQRLKKRPSWVQSFLDRASLDSATVTAGFWKPPEDLDKPNLPYIAGFTARIYKQAVPAASKESRPDLSDAQLEAMTQSEAIVSSSPAYNEPSSSGRDTAQLTIAAPIAIGAARGSQVVTVMVTPVVGNGCGKAFEAVAKIYDPLYYSFKSDLAHRPRDCVQDAETDHNNEVTAYEHLQCIPETGNFVPKYYGSWVFNLPITIRGQPHTRTIRMILIESLKGTSILSTRIRNDPDRRNSLNSFHYPEGYRLEVLARAMDGYVRLLRKGLIQGDFAGRNIILVPRRLAAPEDIVCGLSMPRIVLIDYNNAWVSEVPLEETRKLPANPASVFSGECLWDNFPGWVPHEWEGEKPQQDWLIKRFTGPGREKLYSPMLDDD